MTMGAVAWSAANAQVSERVLDNGLKVVVKEDHRAPTAVQMIWYRTGSIDEVNGRTGIAHVLEHMMFKGTRRFGDGEFSRRVAERGGRENAFTSRDYTAYFQQVPPEDLDEMMMLEADRMTNLQMALGPFEKELAVVMEERRSRIEDSPFGQVGEQMMAMAFSASPYRAPIIGWMNDIENLTPKDALDWYKDWYAPNNAVLIVAGDVEPDAVFEMAQKHYGSIPKRALPERRAQTEPEQKGIRRAVVKAPAQSPYVVMAFKVPRIENLDDPSDAYALEMLAAVLGSGDTGRLTREIVRGKQLANDADAGYGLLGRGPALFTLSGTPLDGGSITDLEKVLRGEITRIANDGVKETELQRIKAQYVASRVFGRDSLFGQVMEVGLLEMVGLSHRDTDRLLEKIRDVNAEQVKAVAARYFGDDQLTVVTLDPQPLDQKPRRQVDPSIRLKH
ncbi:MAG: M16 family metallopeptidase [Burkholderiaceae bacterium]